jgi:cell division protein FtsW
MTSQVRPIRAQRHPESPRTDAPPAAFVAVRRLFAMETPNFFLLLGTVLFLVAFGLVMVLSSSSIESRTENASFFTAFLKQGLYALIALPAMLLASRMPIRFWKRMARPAIVIAVGMQLLVIPFGLERGGNRNWIDLGPVTAQPSELAKLALILWIAFALTREVGDPNDPRRFFVPVGAASVLSIGLVLYGNDLGTAVISLSIVFGCLFFAGVKLRYLFTAGLAVTLLGIAFAFASSSRSGRISVWIHGCTDRDYYQDCWQPLHGTWALAGGGIFGVGLGNSKAKWNWLPEADNDYIFSIIGEELGLIGALLVLVLFVVLAISFVRVIRMNPDPFAKIVTSGVLVWLVGQALVNIAVVLGLLPVLGVPLPLISAGGSALITSLFAIGVVLSFARKQTTDHIPISMTPADRSRLAAQSRSTQ